LYPVLPGAPETEQDPVYTFDIDSLKHYLDLNAKGWVHTFADWIDQSDYAFNPSAIAFDPLSGNAYVLSHPEQQLLILSPGYRIKALTFLDPAYFRQPEGICFDPKGNLYISNEGGTGAANILIFKRKTIE
jgi:uncharacterized protein YjiK